MQSETMKYDPATGEPRPYPSHAAQWRRWHGHNCAWLFNPWSGERRDARDVGSDTNGRLIVPHGTLGSDLGVARVPDNSAKSEEWYDNGEQGTYPECDKCGKSMDYTPWHYSKGSERHLHACDECWPKVGAAPDAAGLVEALDLMVTTHDEGGWPTATIMIARAALAAYRKGGDV